MIFRPLRIPGAFAIEMEPAEDARGSFARAFCVAEFIAAGLDPRVAQTSLSSNRQAGTLRGMHYAASPSTEAKLVRCVRGRVFDVLLDLRGGLPSFRSWLSEELSAANGRSVYVPAGVAHGYLTLEDESTILYQMTEPHNPCAARGARFDDPAFGIRWPMAPTAICERDWNYPILAD